MTLHRWVLIERVPDYLLIGWLALPTLEGTHHGRWSVHCIWLCACRAAEPRSIGAVGGPSRP
jgi:hypothetical protein